MTTFTFSAVDEACGIKASKTFHVDDKEGERILDCYAETYGCKGHEAAIGALAAEAMNQIVNRVCAYERARAATPIVPKPE